MRELSQNALKEPETPVAGEKLYRCVTMSPSVDHAPFISKVALNGIYFMWWNVATREATSHFSTVCTSNGNNEMSNSNPNEWKGIQLEP